MPETPDDFHTILRDASRFLKQQQETYGDVVFRKEKAPVPAPTNVSTAAPLTKPITQPAASAEPQLALDVATPASGRIAGPPANLPNEPWTATTTLDALNAQICTCLKCGLGHTRKNFVFGVGNPRAEVVVIGEAPGADEDAQGEPFVGRAGQLLNKILEAVQFKREEVYICNILKCRPPENRRPTPEETELCEPYLWKQLEILKPKMILALGLTAAQALLKTNLSLGQLRGTFHDYRGIKLMVTYHPAALLRNPNWKKPVWEDVQIFRKTYDELKSR